MTENESIDVLKNLAFLSGKKEHEKCEKAIEMAIQALEKQSMVNEILHELREYSAIGTVEELKTAMKYVSLAKKHGTVGKAIDACAEYESIGTIDEFKALKEKNEPKELYEHNFQDEVHHYLCPSCRSIVSCNQNYCDECGQALET